VFVAGTKDRSAYSRGGFGGRAARTHCLIDPVDQNAKAKRVLTVMAAAATASTDAVIGGSK